MSPDLSFATLIEPSGDITPRVLAALPKPDVKLDAEFPRLTYAHRSWRDAEMYFFFNESNKAESRVATIAGRGQAQAWDLATGEIHPISGATAEGDSVRFPLVLGPYEAKLVVVGPLPGGVAAPEPSLASGNTLAELGGDWTLDLNGKQVTTPLKSWEDLGTPSFAGPATYHKQFTAPTAPAGKHVFLEIADVRDYARIKLNGKELEAHAWQPYRWDITGALKAGSNDLEIQVNATPAGRGGSGGPPPAGAMPTAAGGRGRQAAPAGCGPGAHPPGRFQQGPGSVLAAGFRLTRSSTVGGAIVAPAIHSQNGKMEIHFNMRRLIVLGVAFLSLATAQETRREITNATTPAEDAKPNSAQVPDVYAVASQFQRVLIFRFKYQADLLAGMEKMVKENKIRNAVILSGAGSVRGYQVHQVSNRTMPSKNMYEKNPTAPADLISMNGYIINGKVHAHMTLANPDKAFGGHLEPGTEVFTFAIVTVGVLPDSLDLTKLDDKTYR